MFTHCEHVNDQIDLLESWKVGIFDDDCSGAGVIVEHSTWDNQRPQTTCEYIHSTLWKFKIILKFFFFSVDSEKINSLFLFRLYKGFKYSFIIIIEIVNSFTWKPLYYFLLIYKRKKIRDKCLIRFFFLN